MKYIIELEKIEGTELWKAKGCNTLVFDKNGIDNILKPYEDDEFEAITYSRMKKGDIIRCKNGKTLYEFHGLSNNAKRINTVNVSTGNYVCLPSDDDYVRKVNESIMPFRF